MHGVNTGPTVLRASLTGASLAALSALLAACPPATECQHRLDCPSGEICNAEGSCIPEPDVGEGEGEPHDAGPIGEGEGEADAGVPLDEVLINLQASPPTMLLPDPLTGPANALLATASPAEDRVARFAIADDNPTFETVLDFLNVSLPNSCALDSLGVFDASFLDLDEREIWWSCKSPANVRVWYPESNPSANQLYEDLGLEALEISYAYTSTDDPNLIGRVVAAPRDGTLQILQIGAQDQQRVARGFDTTTDLGLDAVAGVWPVVKNDPTLGDILIVYDRGEEGNAERPQRLVPIQRQFAQTTWSTTLVNVAPGFVPIELPDEAHYALFLPSVGINDPLSFQVDDVDADTPNIIVFLPTLGEVRFYRYEVEALTPGTEAFRPLRINGVLPTELPPREDRVLLSAFTAGGRPYFFYALTHQAFAWRLPTHENRNADRSNEVLATQTERADERYVGMVPVDAVDAWFAGTASGQYFLRRMGFSVSGL